MTDYNNLNQYNVFRNSNYIKYVDTHSYIFRIHTCDASDISFYSKKEHFQKIKINKYFTKNGVMGLQDRFYGIEKRYTYVCLMIIFE